MYSCYPPAARQAAAKERDSPTETEEVKVTSEMLDAGFRVLWDSGAVENPMADVDRELVRRIFIAMRFAQRPHSMGVPPAATRSRGAVATRDRRIQQSSFLPVQRRHHHASIARHGRSGRLGAGNSITCDSLSSL